MKRENLLWGGVLGPVVYVIAVVLGGIFTPGYSHLRQAVSELIEAGAVHKLWLDPLFIVYNLGVLAFGLGLLAMIKAQSSNQSRRFGTWGGGCW